MSVLKKGLKFTPSTNGNYFDIKNDMDQFTRRLKIREIFWDQSYSDDSLVRGKSNRHFSSNNIHLNNLIRTFDNLEPDKITGQDNLSRAERDAIKKLKNNSDIVIKPADKGNAIVIMNSYFYRDKLILDDHLSTNSYEKVELNSDETLIQDLKALIHKHYTCLTEKEREYIKNDEWKTSEFYIMPKIHKCPSIINAISQCTSDVVSVPDPPDLKGRPIVAGVNTPTRRLSELISKILKPIVESQKTYIKDDWDVLSKLPFDISGDYNLFGCDITSLYTSIPHDLGLKAIRYWIRKRRDLILPRYTETFILESIELMLKNNNFLFNDEMFRQLIGTAMGHIFAPQYACLVIGYLEEEKLFKDVLPRHFSEEEVRKILKYFCRYMDDGNSLLPKTVNPTIFLECLNSLHPNIVFTLEPARSEIINGRSAQCLDFLDITIILFDDGGMETDIHYKSTNSHKYLDYNSFHPLHTKNNIPYCLAKRIICFVYNSDTMWFRLNQLRTWLLECNYPKHIIERGIKNARLQGPAPEPTNKSDVIPFVTTFANNLDTTNLTKNIQVLINYKKFGPLKNVLENVKVVTSYRQPKNLGKLLTKAKFSETIVTPITQSHPKPTPGLFANCTDPRCNLCKYGYIQTGNSFTCTNGDLWDVRSHINCNTHNVIYYLVCNMCNKESYIGKTYQKLRGRTNDHISKCRLGTGSNKFDRHVHNCGIKRNCLKAPYFKIFAFMALSSSQMLLSYERYLQRKGLDTLNNPFN